jgi:hypothetical protein
MEFISKIKELVSTTKMYAELRLRELKLDVVEKVSATFADVTAGITLLVFALIFIFFISVSAALLLNSILTSAYLGFLIIGFFWLIAGLIIYAARKALIKKPVRNWIIEKVMNNEKVD